MSISIKRSDIIWSYLAQLLNYGGGLFILPVILTRLPTEHIAIWYIFLAITSATSLLDFGFQPNLMRNVAYVMAGSKELTANGTTPAATTNEVNWSLFWSLVYTARRIYRIIAIIVFAVLISLGTFYIYNITREFKDQYFVMVSWFIYLLVSVFNFYFCYYNPLLLGRGLVKEYNLTIIVTKSSLLLLSILTLQFGMGLMGVVLALLIATLIDRFFARFFFFRNLKEPDNKNYENLFSVLWSNTWKLGLVTLGGFLILRANIFLVSKYLPLNVAASYGLSLQLLTTLMSFGTIFFTAHLPKISSDRLQENNDHIKRIVGNSLIISWGVYILSAGIIILFGNKLLYLINSKTALIPTFELSFLSLILFLEMNHSLFATLITTKNTVPFVKPAVISGALVVCCSFFSLKYLPYGLTGILSAQFIIQLSYNNWKWPYMGLKDLNTNLNSIVKESLTNWMRKK